MSSSSSTANNNCSVVDDYAVMFDGALYIRKVNKNATPEEKRKRRAQYMKRYRTGRKGVVKKEGAKKKTTCFCFYFYIMSWKLRVLVCLVCAHVRKGVIKNKSWICL